MKFFYIYPVCLVALSGLGVVSFNEESILALCFFIFVTLVFQNSDAAVEALEETRSGIKKQLTQGMLDQQLDHMTTQQLRNFELAQLVAGSGHLKG